MIKNLLGDEENETDKKQRPEHAAGGMLSVFDTEGDADSEKHDPEPFILSEAKPETNAEIIRRSGIAWSMGIAFFASVVFTMILGWGADLLLGTAPWGVVAGIVLGALVGFMQIFRLSSQTFRK